MTITSNEVRLAPFGHVYVAAVGSTIPATVTTPFGAPWTELGYVSEDGVAFTPSVDINDINAWQSKVPIKRSLTGIDFDIKFTLMQTNQKAASLFFFDSTWSVAGSQANLSVSSSPTLVEYALAVEYTDDLNNVNRIIVPRSIVTDRDDLTLNKSDNVKWGLTIKALDYNGSVVQIQSNNPDLLHS